MQRYFINTIDLTSKTAILSGNDFHHLKNVMRHRIDDKIIVCDFEGHCFLSTISEFQSNSAVCHVKDEISSTEMKVSVDIAQGLIRREKFEYMLQKSSELGANKIIPTMMRNSIVKVEDKKSDNKITRWNAITKEACEQSHRNRLCLVTDITDMASISYHDYDLVLVCYEEEKQSKSLKSILETKQYQNILVVIGPEGGLSKDEIQSLTKKDHVHLVGLGPRILRSETASSYVLSVISYVTEMSE
ncbi:MAG: 16S rRNA (uracil(1498)-N(3))-methyltransferase [Bacilli bacterium]|nr:16S rRNA (uracil(1498)-N(3))-methyltransferase [Bacilli bacterium]